MCVEAYRQRREDEYIERLSMAWYTAKWSQARKIPPLKKMIDEIRGAQPAERKRQQTPEEMLATAMRLNAQNKGEIVTGGASDGRST